MDDERLLQYVSDGVPLKKLVAAGLTLGVLALTKSVWAYFAVVVAAWLLWRRRSQWRECAALAWAAV